MSKPAPPETAHTQDALSATLGWSFKDETLLREALTHGSAGGDQRTYDRLEFLGDRVLGLVAARFVYASYPEDSAGDLAVRFNALVDRHACARAARRAGLEQHIIAARPKRDPNFRLTEAILADVCESVIAALYLEGGYDVAQAFILRFWGDALEQSGNAQASPKNLLQEWAAARRRKEPAYDVVSREGPDHAPVFIVEARVEGLEPVRAEGASKRDAERAAAIALLKQAGVDV
ncbi:MAG: ribonuclease III [Alphaproteobacteria bacterium]|nr:ribonuclease III [Alphaproteobacteria bacterium]